MMAASLRREGEWVQGTAREAVTPPAKTLGRLALCIIVSFSLDILGTHKCFLYNIFFRYCTLNLYLYVQACDKSERLF